MDFVKREDQNLIEEDQYRTYLENLQKTHQMEAEYQHTPISMEQLHQAMQTSLNATTIVHNFQIPLSPRQMSTLMLKTNHLSRNINFTELPTHVPRYLTELDLQNLTQDIPICRPEDLVLTQNPRNLDLSLPRNLSNEELQNSLAQSLVQNLTEQDLVRNLNNDLSQNLNRINDVMPNLRDLPHNLTQEIDLSHLNRQNLEQELLTDRRTPMIGLQENLIEQNLSQRLDQVGQRLVNTNLYVHDTRPMNQSDHLIPMPFHIKSEQEDDGYFYDGINHNPISVNGVNGHVPVPEQLPTNLHQDSQLYTYNTHNINIPNLNPIDIYSRTQNYVNARENPQNLVVHRQYDNNAPYHEEFKKYRQDGDEIAAKEKEQPKENLKPNENKNFYADFQNQNVFQTDKDDENSDNKLTISEDMSLIKGEYACYKCNEIFPSKRGLKQHAKTCTDLENDADEKSGKFSCSQCAYKCQSPAILKIHERVHTGEKPFKCTFCDYKSGQKNNVAKHILVHMQQKPYRCQYCEYRCAQKNNLVVHERTHTGFKPFACPYCDYRTVQKPNLVKHMYLHTDQKPFSCDQCSYRCVQKTNLTKHKQRHLNEKEGEKIDIKNQAKPYRPRQKSVKCPLCTYRCVQKSSLEKHMQFKHPENNENSELITENQEPASHFLAEFDENVPKMDDSVETIQNLSVKKDDLYQENEIKVQS